MPDRRWAIVTLRGYHNSEMKKAAIAWRGEDTGITGVRRQEHPVKMYDLEYKGAICS